MSDEGAEHTHEEIVDEKKKVIGFILIEIYEDGSFNFGSKDVYEMAVPGILDICAFRALKTLKDREEST